MVLQKICLTQNFCQISLFSLYQFFLQHRLEVFSFARLRKSWDRRKDIISLAVSQGLGFTIHIPTIICTSSFNVKETWLYCIRWLHEFASTLNLLQTRPLNNYWHYMNNMYSLIRLGIVWKLFVNHWVLKIETG